MGRVMHFEIHADDVERAKQFYGAVFGWTFQDWTPFTGDPYWGAITGAEGEAGINGAIVTRMGSRPAPGQGLNAFACTMQVTDYDATHERILASGGVVALPKYALTGMAWQGYYLDPEGNTFGIHQPDVNAK